MKYTVVIGETPNNYSAYSPDVLGCVSVGKTPEEMREMIREALEFHFEGMEFDGDQIPIPSSVVETITIEGRNYLAVYEKDLDGFCAYVPDFLPECEVTGGSVEEARQNLRKAVADYLAAMELKGEQLPEPSSWAETMEIPHPSEVPA